jgi:hypothetical protein
VPNLLITKKLHCENEEARLMGMMGVIEAMKGLRFAVPMVGNHAISHSVRASWREE